MYNSAGWGKREGTFAGSDLDTAKQMLISQLIPEKSPNFKGGSLEPALILIHHGGMLCAVFPFAVSSQACQEPGQRPVAVAM